LHDVFDVVQVAGADVGDRHAPLGCGVADLVDEVPQAGFGLRARQAVPAAGFALEADLALDDAAADPPLPVPRPVVYEEGARRSGDCRCFASKRYRSWERQRRSAVYRASTLPRSMSRSQASIDSGR
jgi:hypothetical protein